MKDKARELLLWILAASLLVTVCVCAAAFSPDFSPVGIIYSETPTTAAATTDNTVPPTLKVNINTATLEQLMLLPEIGEVYASYILEYRQDIGKFTSIEQLLDVKGIGQKRFQAIKDFVTIK